MKAPRPVKPRNKGGKDWGDEDAAVLVTSAVLCGERRQDDCRDVAQPHGRSSTPEGVLLGVSRPARRKCAPRDAPAITKQHESLRRPVEAETC